MIFKCELQSYITRYFPSFPPMLAGLLVIIFLPIFFLNDPLKVYMTFIMGFLKVIVQFPLSFWLVVLGFAALLHVVMYFATQKYPKRIEISDSYIKIWYFNGKEEEVNFKDILEIKRSSDLFKNFIFKMKDGKEKLVYAAINNSKKAYELMQVNFLKYD